MTDDPRAAPTPEATAPEPDAAKTIGRDDPRWPEVARRFAAQTEDRLAELSLRMPDGEFDDDDLRLVEDARFALTQLLDLLTEPAATVAALTAERMEQQQKHLAETANGQPQAPGLSRDAPLAASRYLAQAFHPPQCRANRYVVSGGLTDGSMCDCGLTALRALVRAP